jgi:hypothetical protein
MFRKLWLGIGSTLIVATIAASTVTGVAFARTQSPSGRDANRPTTSYSGYVGYASNYSQTQERSDSGQVVAVSMNEFTIRTSTGQDLIFRLDAGTKFEDGQKQAIKESDLSVGKWVTVYAPHADRSELPDNSRMVGQMSGGIVSRMSHLGKLNNRETAYDLDDGSVAALVIISAQAPSKAPAATTPAAKP